MRPLDIVRVRRDYFDGENESPEIKLTSRQKKRKERSLANMGLVTEVDGSGASVRWFLPDKELYTAWWNEEDLEVVGNLAAILSDEMAHPFGGNRKQGEKFYGEKREKK